MLYLLLFDNSGSVTGGNDPVGNRFLEAKVAIDRVSRRCRCKHEAVGLLHFDTPTSACINPAVPLDRRGRSALEGGLRVPPDGAGTSELGPSLTVARQMAAQHPRHTTVLLAASDFELLDNDVDQVIDDLNAFPGVVHALVLRAPPPARLTESSQVTVSRVGYDSPPGSAAEAVFAALTAARSTPGSSPRRGQDR